MNPREKRLAAIVGVFAGVLGVWMMVNWLFISEVKKANQLREGYSERYNKLKRLEDDKLRVEKIWLADAARTFSFNETLAKDMLQLELKRIALRHGFDSPNVKTAMGIRIGVKTQIKSPAASVTLIGDYVKVMAFVRDIYRAPFLCQITNLAITPLGPRYGRNNVKLDVTVETPVLPERIKDITFAEAPRTIPTDPAEPLDPVRRGVAPDSYYAIFDSRNLFREFIPAPTNVVLLDNQDRKMVGVKGVFYYDGKEETQFQKGVSGNSQVQVEGKGDVLELTIAYADGHSEGPIRHEFKSVGPWAYKVASRTPPEPPKIVNLAVQNSNAEEVLLNIVVTTEDDKQLRPPTMLIEANQTIDIGEWRAKQIQVSATYRSRKPAPGGTYMPSDTKQTLTIPPEPDEPVFVNTNQPPPEDAPPDDQYKVAGLWTYRDVQEMIVVGGTGRRVITLNDEGAVDGGTLRAVHPLGGVVYMPATGNYYLYPLGKTFGKRVWLDVEGEEGLADAIDAWSRTRNASAAVQ